MRSAPFASLWALIRVAVKALCILAVANFIFLAIGVDPLQKLIDFNLWGLVGHGRARLIYASDPNNGELPIEALLSAHTIAYTPKTPDEYRVVMLGDSGINGWGVPDADTLAGQLNARHLRDGDKRVVFYNFGYPTSSAARDTIILDALRPYHPDLILWFMTLSGLENGVDTELSFLELNRARLMSVAAPAGLQDWVDKNVPISAMWPSWSAIRSPELFSIWLKSLSYPFTTTSIGASRVRLGMEPLSAKAQFMLGQPSVTPFPGETWNFLLLGQKLASGADLLLINETTLVSSQKNSDINYNPRYQRQLYDQYRVTLADYAKQHHFWYLDLWNIVPAEHFTDSDVHMDAEGWAMVADHLTAELQNVKGIHS